MCNESSNSTGAPENTSARYFVDNQRQLANQAQQNRPGDLRAVGRAQAYQTAGRMGADLSAEKIQSELDKIEQEAKNAGISVYESPRLDAAQNTYQTILQRLK